MGRSNMVEDRPDVVATMQQVYEPVNLDGFMHDADGDCANLVALENVYGRLACYIDAKRRAMKFRIQGDIEAALSWEQLCERQYDLLPSWAKWAKW